MLRAGIPCLTTTYRSHIYFLRPEKYFSDKLFFFEVPKSTDRFGHGQLFLSEARRHRVTTSPAELLGSCHLFSIFRCPASMQVCRLHLVRFQALDDMYVVVSVTPLTDFIIPTQQNLIGRRFLQLSCSVSADMQRIFCTPVSQFSPRPAPTKSLTGLH